MNVGFISLGCSKNLVDTEIMINLVKKAGYTVVSDKNNADIIVINTCGFIDAAKEEAISEILKAAEYKKKGRLSQLIAAGCLAQRYTDEIATELPEVDKIVGVASFKRIVEIIQSEGKIFKDDFEQSYKGGDRVLTTPSHYAYLKISEGCDNRCTYCAIPGIRGRNRSRTYEDIKEEALRLYNMGISELIVIAQDTTRYGIDIYGESRLGELLEMLSDIGFKWIRVMYTYPELLTDDVIDIMINRENILNYFDIPIQHISSSVLKRMGRKSTKESIYALFDKLKKHDVTLRTSLMVGFPGETDEDFKELCEFAEYAKIDRVGVFKYSREEGTPAYKLPDQIEESVKQERYDTLMSIQNKISYEKNKSMKGKEIQVLVEGFEDFMYVGRSRADAPDIDGKVYFGAQRDIKTGEYVRVKILDAEEYDLMGSEICGKDDTYEFTE